MWFREQSVNTACESLLNKSHNVRSPSFIRIQVCLLNALSVLNVLSVQSSSVDNPLTCISFLALALHNRDGEVLSAECIFHVIVLLAVNV